MNSVQVEYLHLHSLLEETNPVPYGAIANLKVKKKNADHNKDVTSFFTAVTAWQAEK